MKLEYGKKCVVQIPDGRVLEAIYKGVAAGANLFEDTATLHIIRIPLDLEIAIPASELDTRGPLGAPGVAGPPGTARHDPGPQGIPNIPGRNHPKTIAVDFDGTLAAYDPKDYPKIGEPLPGMIDLLKKLKVEDWNIIVFTCRGADEVKAWLDSHEVPYHGINHDPGNPREKSGKVMADVYLDDKAVRFMGDATVAYAEIQKAMAG